jgi:hypothetical protein
MSNANSKHTVMYLKEFCPFISNEHLKGSSSYILHLSVSGGETYIVVAKSMDYGVPFLQILDLFSLFCLQKRTPKEVSLELEKFHWEKPYNLKLD